MSINACIVACFMPNVSDRVAEMQRKVVDKLNKSKYPFLQFKTEAQHCVFVDYFWCLNGVTTAPFVGKDIKQQFDFDVMLLLDIDAIPVSEDAIDYYVQRASENVLIGNIQRANHLDNNKHLYAAPSACAISKKMYIDIGSPSCFPNKRSDVSEEWTWAAQEKGYEVEFIPPIRFDRAPHKYDWEENKDPWWELGEGMPVYGLGTTFGTPEKGDLFWHNFQIIQPGQEEAFCNKCEEVLRST